MSDDLIRRQDAVSRMSDLICELKSERLPTWDEVYNAMSDLPSIQPEQKTGRWEHDGGHFANRWICSQCGYKFYFEKSEAKYCPNCGAKMMEGVDDDE